MYYADEISVDIAIKLLEKLEQSRDKRRNDVQKHRRSS